MRVERVYESYWERRKHVYGDKVFCHECGFESSPTKYCGDCGRKMKIGEDNAPEIIREGFR